MNIWRTAQGIMFGVLLVVPSVATAAEGGITGAITEEGTGKPIAGAQIRVIAKQGKSRGGAALAEIVAVQDSDTEGKFTAPGLANGTYTVVVTHPEFKSSVQREVQVGGTMSSLTLTLAPRNRY